MAKILTGNSYPYRFNTPRSSAFDEIENVPFKSGKRIWAPLQAVSLPLVRPGDNHELLHTFNTVPLSLKPFLVSYEGEIPRAHEGWGKEAVGKACHAALMSDRCRGIFPISRFSQRLAFLFAARNQYLRLDEKPGEVVYPSIAVAGDTPKTLDPDNIVLTFVGKHWARKGGAVAALAARLLKARGRKVTVNIVSQMAYGDAVYTDTHRGFYRNYLESMAEDNVRHYPRLPNAEVMRMLAGSTFTLLPTLDDSFGFSVLESMSLAVPVIASGVCAIPEIITHQKDGVLLDMPLDAIGRWRHLPSSRAQRMSPAYQSRLASTFNQLARHIVVAVEQSSDTPDAYSEMSARCLETIREKFESRRIAWQWHGIYERMLHPLH